MSAPVESTEIKAELIVEVIAKIESYTIIDKMLKHSFYTIRYFWFNFS